MEDIKLAFETIVVGLMAIPWLLIFLHIFFYFLKSIHLFSRVPEFVGKDEKSFAILGTLILGAAYCLGSIIFPLADNLFNDNEDYIFMEIKKDGDIRADVLADLYFHDKFYQLAKKDFQGLDSLFDSQGHFKPETSAAAQKLADSNEQEEDEKKGKKEKEVWGEKKLVPKEEKKSLYKSLKNPFHAIYNYQKFTVLNSNNGYDVLKPLSSRIVILRGAVFNALFLLLALVSLAVAALLDYYLNLFYDHKARILDFWLFTWNKIRGDKRGDKHDEESESEVSKRVKSKSGKLKRGIFYRIKSEKRVIYGYRSEKEREQAGIKLKKRIIYGENNFWTSFIMLVILIILVWVFCRFGAWGVTTAETEYDKNVVGLFYGRKAREETRAADSSTAGNTNKGVPRSASNNSGNLNTNSQTNEENQ